MKKQFRNKINRMGAVTVALCMAMGMTVGCGTENAPSSGETNISAITSETQLSETAASEAQTSETVVASETQAAVPSDEVSVYSGTPDTSWYTGSENEYVLTTADQLMGFQQLRAEDNTFEGITIKLGASMTINEGTADELKAKAAENYAWAGLNSENEFKGTFDGQGNTISGVYMQLASAAKKGMFGTLGENATIKNFTLDNSYFGGPTAAEKSNFGAIAGLVTGKNVLISNVNVKAIVEEGSGEKLANVGGFIGAIIAEASIIIENCTFDGSVTTTGECAGGFLGYLSFSKAEVIIKNCTCNGVVTAANGAGDIIGWAKKYAALTTDGCIGQGTLIGKEGKDE